MPEHLFRKLRAFRELSPQEKAAIEDATHHVQEYAAGEDIIREGDAPDHVHLVIDGWAARYKSLEDGKRPILGYLIPGDLCDLHVSLLRQMDHSIGALSPCKLALIDRMRLEALMEKHRELAKALHWSTLVDEAILREWLVTIGHRNADKRLAHFFCEMFLRSKTVGLVSDSAFKLPLTQEEIGDTMGLSAVHVNRTLQVLRAHNLITLKGRALKVLDLGRLMEFSNFNPNYLHQQAERVLRA